jgi:hypothetical protein
MAGRRPGGVTLVSVLVIIEGILELVVGILALAGLVFAGAGPFAGFAIIPIVLGILTILVGLSLLRGGQIARGITTVVLVLNLAFAIWRIVLGPHDGGFWGSVVSGAISLIGIILLWTRRASEFFRG